MRSADVQHIADWQDARHARRLARGIAVATPRRRARLDVRRWIDDDKAAPPGIVLAHERKPGRGLLVSLDDDVLEKFAEACFDSAFEAAVDFEIIRHGALLADVAIGLHEDHSGGIREFAAGGDELLERGEPRLETGAVHLAPTHAAGARSRFGG